MYCPDVAINHVGNTTIFLRIMAMTNTQFQGETCIRWVLYLWFFWLKLWRHSCCNFYLQLVVLPLALLSWNPIMLAAIQEMVEFLRPPFEVVGYQIEYITDEDDQEISIVHVWRRISSVCSGGAIWACGPMMKHATGI